MSEVVLTLSVLTERLAVCRLDAHSVIPTWATGGSFLSATRTSDQLSVVCPERDVPADVKCERGWRAFKIEGPFDFASTGILAAVAGPLAAAEVSILAIATYDTDYILVNESQLERAACVLSAHGHTVHGHEH